jgi:aminopeptidase N
MVIVCHLHTYFLVTNGSFPLQSQLGKPCNPYLCAPQISGKKQATRFMKRIQILFFALAILLFYKCDPAKKIYSGPEYKGTIDTGYTEEYLYEDDGEYAYDDYADEGGSDSAYSHYSPEVYKYTEPRVNDILHTKLEVRFDWEKAWMYGKATLTVKPYYKPVSQLILDAKGFEIKEVSMLQGNTKTALHYTYNKDTIPDTFQIVIDLGKEFNRDQQYQIFIDYIAKPNTLPLGGSAAITADKGLYFINNTGAEKNKPKQIWTQGETEASSCWFPTIDKPNEKTTQEIFITVEDRYKTLSNGILISSNKNTDGTRTDYWKMDLPHAPYLFMMAIGEYAIITDTWKNKEVSYYVEPEYAPYARKIFGNTPEMLTFFSNTLGVEFPWQKYNSVIVRDYVSGAMENTTATVFGEFIQQTDKELLDETYEDVVSHELFHSWFGDYVTTESWSNLPLNESFATYGEYLWNEYKYGRDVADYHRMQALDAYLSESQSKQVDLIRFYYADKEDMFDSHSYAKGGCILHMLRKYLGDEAFFAGLNKYLSDNKFATAEIHNLRLAFEAVTGEDLNWFFNQWFLNSGHPEIYTGYYYDDFSGKVMLNVQQLQDTTTTPVYVLPVDVDIYSNGNITRHRILVDRRIQIIPIPSATKPDAVVFDAERMIVGNVYPGYSNEEHAFLYKHSKLFQDRYDAVRWLSYDNASNTVSYDILLQALNDPSWVIRQFAVDTIHIDETTPSDVKNKIMHIAMHDSKSYVRSSAVARLRTFSDIDIMPALNKALTDSSYTVLSTALSVLYDIDSVKAAQEARGYKDEKNINLAISVWDILSKAGDTKDNDYFLQQFNVYTGWQQYYVMIYYIHYLQQQEDSYIINKGIDQFKKIALEQHDLWTGMFAASYITNLKDYFTTEMINQSPSTQSQWKIALEYIDKALAEIPSPEYPIEDN